MRLSIIFFLLFIGLTSKLTSQEKGTFKISTNPQYAYISLDGFPDVQKKSPAEFKDYRSLTYRIKISKHNYYDLDTVITCYADSIIEYTFDLVPKTGSLNITSTPDHANVYFNNQAIGVTPLIDFPVPCGASSIRIASAGYGEFSNTYVINEDSPLSISHDFTQSTVVNNATHSTPVNTGFDDHSSSVDIYDDDSSVFYDDADQTTATDKTGFGTLGFYTMIGSNGAEGTSFRYGADIMHILRLFGENNSTSNIKGIGLEAVLPADLNGVGLYGKLGVMARTYKSSYSHNITTKFVTLGGGLSIKPSPHFQIFGELEVGLYDEEQNPEDVQAWKKQFPEYSTFNAWLGIRLAF